MKTLLNKKLIEISKEKAEELANYYRKQIINMGLLGCDRKVRIIIHNLPLKDI